VEVDAHDVVITPEVNVTLGTVNFRRHPAAAANEPASSKLANAFTQASVVEAYESVHALAPELYGLLRWV
jgi:ATP phosphoribosyltransferase regulatory subunit HisZ